MQVTYVGANPFRYRVPAPYWKGRRCSRSRCLAGLPNQDRCTQPAQKSGEFFLSMGAICYFAFCETNLYLRISASICQQRCVLARD